MIIVPAVGGAGVGAAAAVNAQQPAQELGDRSGRQAFSSFEPTAPTVNPDARRLPQIGGDAGDLRPPKGFQSIN